MSSADSRKKAGFPLSWQAACRLRELAELGLPYTVISYEGLVNYPGYLDRIMPFFELPVPEVKNVDGNLKYYKVSPKPPPKEEIKPKQPKLQNVVNVKTVHNNQVIP